MGCVEIPEKTIDCEDEVPLPLPPLEVVDCHRRGAQCRLQHL